MAKSNPKDNGVQIPFTDENFLQKWQEWLEYRKEMRFGTYKPIGLKQTFTKLVDLSGNNPVIAIQIINESMANGWRGLFQLKLISNGTTHTRFIKDKPEPTGNVVTGGFGQL